jgi:hypothetical protein
MVTWITVSVPLVLAGLIFGTFASVTCSDNVA